MDWKEVIGYLCIFLIVIIIGYYGFNKYGYRYAGIKELQRLEQRVKILEKRMGME